MNRLWAPWRIKYLRIRKNKRCIFCGAKKNVKNSYPVFITRYSICMLNIFPYNNGHLMVAPLRHLRDTAQLTDKEALDLMQSVNKAKALLDKVLKPHGYNLGLNLSRSAGAGIPGHLHIHIVPRWQGDSNFMPIVHGTKVISQSLEELQRLLKHAQSGKHPRIRR